MLVENLSDPCKCTSKRGWLGEVHLTVLVVCVM
jgi:hypothetical protein